MLASFHNITCGFAGKLVQFSADNAVGSQSLVFSCDLCLQSLVQCGPGVTTILTPAKAAAEAECHLSSRIFK